MIVHITQVIHMNTTICIQRARALIPYGLALNNLQGTHQSHLSGDIKYKLNIISTRICFFSFAYREIPIADALLCQIEAQKRLQEQFEVYILL